MKKVVHRTKPGTTETTFYLEGKAVVSTITPCPNMSTIAKVATLATDLSRYELHLLLEILNTLR